MNRRSFIGKLGLALTAFSILPAATTYSRNWKFGSSESRVLVPNPEWVKAPYEVHFMLASEDYCKNFGLDPIKVGPPPIIFKKENYWNGEDKPQRFRFNATTELYEKVA